MTTTGSSRSIGEKRLPSHTTALVVSLLIATVLLFLMEVFELPKDDVEAQLPWVATPAATTTTSQPQSSDSPESQDQGWLEQDQDNEDAFYEDDTNHYDNNYWIDPDTPSLAHTIPSLAVPNPRSATTPKPQQGDPAPQPQRDPHYRLVFSDEFNVPGRTFQDGSDPRWTALHKNDWSTLHGLHYYSHDAETVHTTPRGSLNIRLDVHDAQPQDDDDESHNNKKELRSGMMQSWNKFCFTGGIVEYKAKLPGRTKQGAAGLWPAIWLMGNLGRATYPWSTDQIWPFSTSACDETTKYSQLLNSCPPWRMTQDTTDNHDNTTHHRNDTQPPIRIPESIMPLGRGRGAPEIDLLEVLFNPADMTTPILSTSLQIAPGVDEARRPQFGQVPNPEWNIWYSPIFGPNATQNNYFYGTWVNPMNHQAQSYRTDSLSTNLPLTQDFFEEYHTFRMEWEPPSDTNDNHGGYVQWFVDDQLVSAVYGDDLRATSKTEIPTEPMYLVMNLAVSRDWGFPNATLKNCAKECYSCHDPECACAMPHGFCDNLPTALEIDSVRVYQPFRRRRNGSNNNNNDMYSLSCSPPNRPTEAYIQANMEKYKLPEQDAPLQEVVIGGGKCQSDADCGTTTIVNRGICVINFDAVSAEISSRSDLMCHCSGNWMGPHCLVHYGPVELYFNDSEWNTDTRDKSPTLPTIPTHSTFWTTIINSMGVVVILLCMVLLIWWCWARQSAPSGSSADDTEDVRSSLSWTGVPITTSASSSNKYQWLPESSFDESVTNEESSGPSSTDGQLLDIAGEEEVPLYDSYQKNNYHVRVQ